MPVVNGYCSLPDLRNHLADGGSSLNTASLERAINAASRAVDRHCGRRFWRDASVTTRVYTPTNTAQLFTDDISTRTGLVVSVGSDGVTFPTTLASTEYVLEPRNADVVAAGDTVDPFAFREILRISGRWTVPADGRPTVQVVARFGWSSIPEDVAQATLLKAAALFKRKDAPFGVAGFGEFGAVRVTRSDIDVLDLLAPYELVETY